MSGTKHTPGPWSYFPASNYEGFAIAPLGILPTLAGVERCGQNVRIMCHNFPGSTEANARLIAAAPELLDFVRRIAGCNIPVLAAEAARLMEKAEGRTDG